jgi:hypothetical protein
MGTSDQAWCGWFYLASAPGTRPIFYAHNATDGWSLYATVDYKLRVYWSNGSTASYSDSGVVLSERRWYFVVANVDRDGLLTVFLDDMATPVLSVDISASAAVNWDSGMNPWMWAASGSTTVNDLRLSRIGHIIGDTLTYAERLELLWNGIGRLYSQLSAGLLAKFSGQDYFNCDERAGGRVENAATPSRIAYCYQGAAITYLLKAKDKPRSLPTHVHPLTITNGNAVVLTNHQIKVTVTHVAGMQDNFGDVRFGDVGFTTEYPHWVESYTSGTSATVWVKVPSVPVGESDMEMRFGHGSHAYTSDGSQTFPFFDDAFTDMAQGPRLGESSQLTIPTPDSTGESLHPSVVYIPNGFGPLGKKWWMVHTPYAEFDNQKENPCIACSDDGITWSDPAGLTNPIASVPSDPAGFQNDPELVYDPDAARLYCYWRRTRDAVDTPTTLLVAYSTDGAVWRRVSDAVDISTLSDSDRLTTLVTISETSGAALERSPCIVREDATHWHYWAHKGDSATPSIVYRTSADGITWSAPAACTLSQTNVTGGATARGLWHMSVWYSEANTKWLMLAHNTTHYTLILLHSTNKTTWTQYSHPVSGSQLDDTAWNHRHYRPALVEYDGNVTVFPSFLSYAGGLNHSHTGRFAPIPATDLVAIANGTITAETANVIWDGRGDYYDPIAPTVNNGIATLDKQGAKQAVSLLRAGTYTFASDKAFRARLKPSGAWLTQIGFGAGRLAPQANQYLLAPGFSEGFQLCLRLTPTKWCAREVADIGETTLQEVLLGADDVVSDFNVWELGLLADGTLRGSLNGDARPAEAVGITNYLASDKYPFVAQGNGVGDSYTLEVDWMLVREYADLEPTVSSSVA